MPAKKKVQNADPAPDPEQIPEPAYASLPPMRPSRACWPRATTSAAPLAWERR